MESNTKLEEELIETEEIQQNGMFPEDDLMVFDNSSNADWLEKRT